MAESERFLAWQDKMADREGSRQSFQIQLDWDNPDDVELIKIIAVLKDKQDFSKVMKMALKIIPALLYENSLDELFSEFVWAKLEMLEYMKELQAVPENPTNGNAATKDDIERLEKLMREQSSVVRVAPNGNGLKPIGQTKKLNVPQIGVPDFQDEEGDEPLLVVKRDEGAGKRATENFLNSMRKLQEA